MKNKDEFIKALIEKGYKPWEDRFKGSEGLYQKRVTDERGTKYFLTVYHWNIGKLDPNTPKPHSFEYDVQFQKDKDGKDNTVSIHFMGDFLENNYGIEVTTIEDAEKFFEDMFNKMEFDYYERY